MKIYHILLILILFISVNIAMPVEYFYTRQEGITLVYNTPRTVFNVDITAVNDLYVSISKILYC